ncbi:MAG: glycosyltransferase family 10 [Phycisphaeraceae bacterium]
MDDVNPPIRVKLLGRQRVSDMILRRQFPNDDPVWGRCKFAFDHDEKDYDWLVVYDELPPAGERLRCPAQNTLLITTEPATIKVYPTAYLGQFAHVLTSQEPFAVNHPGVIRSQCALVWYFGLPLGDDQAPLRHYDQIANNPLPIKDKTISTVCSNKAMGHTLHKLRYDFVQAIDAVMPELDVFGRGVREIKDKAEALDHYKYHLAIENHLAPHHITEKLTDTYLAGALPFYFGAPNASDYFPAESFIPIDIRNTAEAIDQVRQAIADNEYEKRLPAIMEARRQTLEEQNMFAVLSKLIEQLDKGDRGDSGKHLLNRRVQRRRNPLRATTGLIHRYRVQAKLRRESAR